jgi:hypothetical protein
MSNLYKILVRKTERKSPRARSKCIWQDNIKTDLKETMCEVVDWTDLTQDRILWRFLVNMVAYFRVP